MVQAALHFTGVAFKISVTLIGMFFLFDYSLPLKSKRSQMLITSQELFFALFNGSV